MNHLRRRIAVLALAAGLAGAARPALAAFVDHVPLPPDPMTERMREPGSYGGRFVIGQTAAPKTFNAPLANEQNSSDVCGRIWANLADFDNPTQQDVPCVAKSWTWSRDHRTVTFHLRRGLRFSDGHPLTAADVKFSFDVVMDDSLPTVGKDNLASVDPVTGQRLPFTYRMLDSLTFSVTSQRPYALLVTSASTVRILPRHVLEPAWRAGRFATMYGTSTPPEQLVTSGPFRVKRYDVGQALMLERNPYWWGVDVRGHRLPYLDELVFLIVADQNVMALKFHAGEIDAIDNVRPEDYRGYADAREREHFALYDLGPSLNTNFLWFNCNRAKDGTPAAGAVKYAWFSNPVFRRAVSLAIDRDAIIRGPFRGWAVKNWALISPGNTQWYDSTIARADHDPAEARRLLAGLGWRDRDGDGVLEDRDGHSVSFTIATNGDNSVRREMLALVVDDLAKVGIKATPMPLEMSTLIQHIRSDFQYDGCMLGLGGSTPADPVMFPNVIKSTGLTHYWHIREDKPETPQEARMDQLFETIESSTSAPERHKAYHAIAGLMADEQWFVWLPTQIVRLPVRSRFGNVQPSVLPHRILWNVDRFFVRPGAD